MDLIITLPVHQYLPEILVVGFVLLIAVGK